MAVTGPAHRVLVHAHLRAKGTGNAVVARVSARSGDLHQRPLQAPELVQVGVHLLDDLRVIKYAQQIPGPPDLSWARPQRIRNGVRDLQLF